MGNKVLMNNVMTPNGTVFAGTILTDPARLAAVQSSGGVLGDMSNPAIAAMQAIVAGYRARGSGNADMWSEMMTAVWASTTSNGVVQSASITSKYTDFAALGTGVKTFDYLLGAVMPSKARLLALTAEGWTGFDDSTHAVDQAQVGTTVGGTELGAAVHIDVTTGTGFPKAFGTAFAGQVLAAGAQPRVRVSSTVDLKTLTAGVLTVNLIYVLLP